MSEHSAPQDRPASTAPAVDLRHQDQDCAAARLVVTTDAPNYPTAARRDFPVREVNLDVPEVEGAACREPVPTGLAFHVTNVGSAVPPPGTVMIAHAVAGRWIIRYDLLA